MIDLADAARRCATAGCPHRPGTTTVAGRRPGATPACLRGRRVLGRGRGEAGGGGPVTPSGPDGRAGSRRRGRRTTRGTGHAAPRARRGRRRPRRRSRSVTSVASSRYSIASSRCSARVAPTGRRRGRRRPSACRARGCPRGGRSARAPRRHPWPEALQARDAVGGVAHQREQIRDRRSAAPRSGR